MHAQTTTTTQSVQPTMNTSMCDEESLNIDTGWMTVASADHVTMVASSLLLISVSLSKTSNAKPKFLLQVLASSNVALAVCAVCVDVSQSSSWWHLLHSITLSLVISSSAPHNVFTLTCLVVTCVAHTSQLASAWSGPDLVWSVALLRTLVPCSLLLECLLTPNPLRPDPKTCPELSASLLSRLTYSWYTPLARLGLTKTLNIDDIWPVRPEDSVAHNFHLYEQAAKKKLDKDIPLNILRIFWQSYSLHYVSITCLLVISRTLLVLTTTATRNLLTFLEESSQPAWQGYTYLFILFSMSVGKTILYKYYIQHVFMLGVRLRTQVVTAIYRKVMSMAPKARTKFSTGEINNLVATDANRVGWMTNFANLAGVNALQILSVLYLAWLEFGLAIVPGFAALVTFVVIDGFLNQRADTAQETFDNTTDERLKTTSEVLSSAKIIKLYAWEKAFIEKIKKIRGRETEAAADVSRLECISNFNMTFVLFFVSSLTFTTHLWLGGDLSAVRVLYGLSLFTVLRNPITMLPFLFTSLMTYKVSVRRLNNFLSSSDQENYVEPNDDEDTDIVLDKCSFSWPSEEDGEQRECLTDISLRIRPGSFVAVVGEVGSGKTSLLNAILGNMQLERGSIKVTSSASVAYVPQVAWIQNTTLRQNILFGLPLDEARYQASVGACCLGADLQMLSGGDLTEIGEKGINLSGGQRQRTSLARAVYADADIYLLDDTLSAVDSHVGKLILDNVLHPKTGLLRHKTRLVVTNNLTFLPLAHHIVVIHKGRVIEEGNYAQLMKDQRGYLARLSHTYATGGGTGREEGGDEDEVNWDKDEDTTEEGKLIEEEEVSEGKVKLEVYVRYLRAFGVLWMSLLVLNHVVVSVVSKFADVFLTRQSNEQSMHFTALLLYCLLGALSSLLEASAWFAMHKGQAKASVRLHERLLRTMLRQPMSYFDVTPLGRILTRFSKDMGTCDKFVAGEFLYVLLNVAKLLVTIIFISTNLPFFLLILVPIVVTFLSVHKLYIAAVRQLERLESVSKASIHAHLSETLPGVSTIKAYNAADQFIARAGHNIDTHTAYEYILRTASNWLSVRLETLSNVVILVTGSVVIYWREDMDASTIGLIIMYLMDITQVMTNIVESVAECETNFVAVERVFEYTDLPKEPKWNIEATKPAAEWPQGGIQFEDYHTRYRPELDLVLRGLTLSINQGEKVGIVGRTGAGKSSLTLALLRLIESASGKITIDGHDIARLGLHQLRQGLTIIPQDPVLFAGTIRFNLDPFGEHSDQQLWRALELANLRTFVESLDDRLDHVLSEAGGNISLGQRQLMCLARALLKRTSILVLDEASSSVDLESDAFIQRTLRQEFRHSTVLTIAHRIHTIMHYDRVMVLDQGRVIEFASPTTLLEDTNSIFHSLAKDAGIV